jgi:hypothetical protein
MEQRSSGPVNTNVDLLAHDLLDQRELKLAEHLALLLNDDRFDSGSLIEDMIPIYWEQVDDRLRSLDPDAIYRPLYYIHSHGSLRDFKDTTRTYMTFLSGHLEGCLVNLTPSPPQYRGTHRPFGSLVMQLQSSGILSAELADQLLRFNTAFNVPSKHFDAYIPTRWLDERTFSVMETAYAFMLMRTLSIKLFILLKANGVILPHDWPDFKIEWLSWSREINCDP